MRFYYIGMDGFLFDVHRICSVACHVLITTQAPITTIHPDHQFIPSVPVCYSPIFFSKHARMSISVTQITSSKSLRVLSESSLAILRTRGESTEQTHGVRLISNSSYISNRRAMTLTSTWCLLGTSRLSPGEQRRVDDNQQLPRKRKKRARTGVDDA